MEEQVHSDQETTTTCTSTTTTIPLKRSAPLIRKEMLSKGAHFLRFERPASVPLVKEAIDKWQTMQEKGFLITSDSGCILPYEYYRASEKGRGHPFKGHQRACWFFYGRLPAKKNSPCPRNEFGWPSHEEVSHLCHRGDCVRADHIVMEEFWRNRKRNFCGSSGHCDCGNAVKCVRAAFSNDTLGGSQACHFLTSRAEVEEVLSPLKERFPFVLLARSHYKVEDEKREHRNLRKKRRLRQDERRAKKRQRKRAEAES